MSYSYERTRRQTYGASTRRSTLGYWIPLALTVTVATVGIAAWIWSERKEGDDDDDYNDRKAPRRDDGQPPPGYGDPAPYQRGPEGQGPPLEDQGMLARMSGAIRRTPSPQQIFDGASRRVVAGVTAAGAAVGGALSSIREEDRQDFEDHSRWSEEAETRAGEPSRSSGARRSSQSGGKSGKRNTVAIVLSADTDYHNHSEEVSYHQEHAVSSHCPIYELSLNHDIVHPLPSTPPHRRQLPRLHTHLRSGSQTTSLSRKSAVRTTISFDNILLLQHRPRRRTKS